MTEARGLNIHIYPAPIVNESRIYRQTAVVAQAQLFDAIEICGTNSHSLPQTQLLDDARLIRRVGAAAERHSSVLGRILAQIRWSAAVYREYSRREIRAVNAHSVAVLPASWLLARKTGAALIYDTHELETEASASHGLQRRVFKSIERLLIRRTDVVLVVNDEIAQWYERTYPGVLVTSVVNTPPTGDGGVAHDLRATFNIPRGERLYVHVGNIMTARSIPTLLKVFSLREREHLVFLGAGPLEAIVKAAANSHPNIHWHPPVPSEDVVPTLAGADMGLCLIEPTCLSYQLSLPNKAIEYISARLPFIYSPLPAVRRLLPEAMSPFEVTNVGSDLPLLLDSVTEERLQRAQESLGATRLPVWEQEADRMLTRYADALAQREQRNRGGNRGRRA